MLTLFDEDDMPIGVSTFAGLPAASAASGRVYRVTDLSNSLFVSTGTIWRPVTGSCVIAASGASASHTGNTNETALATLTIPAGLMTAQGQLRIRTLWTVTNSANNKIQRVRLGGIGGTAFLSATLTATNTLQTETHIRNRNAQNSQVTLNSTATGVFGTSGSAVTTGSVDTSAAQDLVISAQLANSGETITLEAYTVELLIP